MDKDVIVEKFKDLFKFVICIAIILGIGYYTGFLNGFAPQDFKDAFSKVFYNDSVPAYGNYQPSRISKNAMKGTEVLPVWRNMFNTNKKVVFYIFDENSPTDQDFHRSMQLYLNKTSTMRNRYNFEAYSIRGFKHVPLGEGINNGVCNSFDECKEQHQRAADYSSLASFLERCGKTMCVIYPRKQQFIKLKKRNARDAVIMLNGLRNW